MRTGSTAIRGPEPAEQAEEHSSAPPTPVATGSPFHPLSTWCYFHLPSWSLPPHQDPSHPANLILIWLKTQLGGNGIYIHSPQWTHYPRTGAPAGMCDEETPMGPFFLLPGEPQGPSPVSRPWPNVLSHSRGAGQDSGYGSEGGSGKYWL